MAKKKNIFVIVGSAGNPSANEKLVDHLAGLAKDDLGFTVFADLKTLPHFDPEQSTGDPPRAVAEFRTSIEKADGILICTPEYVFSLPAGLKNALEWCVATTVFSGKPAGLITASAHGAKAHEQLQLIMRTLMANSTADTTLLVQGVKGKISETGNITDEKTRSDLRKFMNAFRELLESSPSGQPF